MLWKSKIYCLCQALSAGCLLLLSASVANVDMFRSTKKSFHTVNKICVETFFTVWNAICFCPTINEITNLAIELLENFGICFSTDSWQPCQLGDLCVLSVANLQIPFLGGGEEEKKEIPRRVALSTDFFSPALVSPPLSDTRIPNLALLPRNWSWEAKLRTDGLRLDLIFVSV